MYITDKSATNKCIKTTKIANIFLTKKSFKKNINFQSYNKISWPTTRRSYNNIKCNTSKLFYANYNNVKEKFRYT